MSRKITFSSGDSFVVKILETKRKIVENFHHPVSFFPLPVGLNDFVHLNARPGHALPDLAPQSLRDSPPDQGRKLLRIAKRVVLVPLQKDLTPLLKLSPRAIFAYFAKAYQERPRRLLAQYFHETRLKNRAGKITYPTEEALRRRLLPLPLEMG